MGKVSLPALRRYGYSGGFSTATLAAGGTLGILIPPSVILVLYAIITEQNIAKLFLAAFIPGILAAIGYVLTISLYVRLYPNSAGTRPAVPMAERWKALGNTWPVLTIFGLVVGGIYAGWFTPLGQMHQQSCQRWPPTFHSLARVHLDIRERQPCPRVLRVRGDLQSRVLRWPLSPPKAMY